jgi:hypothetical protein
MPVVGLKALHLGPCNLGLLFTGMGAGSVAAAAFIIPWLRARYSSNTLVVADAGEILSLKGGDKIAF